MKKQVEFTFRVTKDDAEATVVTTTLDFSDLSNDDIIELASATVIINQLQTKLRSGSLKLEEVSGKEYKVRKPGTRSVDDSAKVEAFKAEFQKITGLEIDDEQARKLMKVVKAKAAKNDETKE